MLLSTENLHHYLVEKKLIQSDDLLSGNYRVEIAAGRNSVFKVTCSNQSFLFIKQSKQTDPAALQITRLEVAAHQLLHNDPQFTETAELLPHILLHDEERNVLISTLVGNSVSLHDYLVRNREFSTDLLVQQARTLSAFHVPAERISNSSFAAILPWILRLDEYPTENFQGGSPQRTELMLLIKNNELIANTLTRLKHEWQASHFIHGDVKWINFLVADHRTDPKLVLIDWELADIGDPLWDVAGLVQSYIAMWVFGLDNDPFRTELMPGMDPFNIPAIQKPVQLLLTTYLELQQIPEDRHSQTLTRIMEYVAVRIIQTSVEGVLGSDVIAANNIRCLQLAFNIFNDPEHALGELLGIVPTPAYP
ncbi:MAG: phosphotransferase [Bacteroidota bacterium]